MSFLQPTEIYIHPDPQPDTGGLQRSGMRGYWPYNKAGEPEFVNPGKLNQSKVPCIVGGVASGDQSIIINQHVSSYTDVEYTLYVEDTLGDTGETTIISDMVGVTSGWKLTTLDGAWRFRNSDGQLLSIGRSVTNLAVGDWTSVRIKILANGATNNITLTVNGHTVTGTMPIVYDAAAALVIFNQQGLGHGFPGGINLLKVFESGMIVRDFPMQEQNGGYVYCTETRSREPVNNINSARAGMVTNVTVDGLSDMNVEHGYRLEDSIDGKILIPAANDGSGSANNSPLTHQKGWTHLDTSTRFTIPPELAIFDCDDEYSTSGIVESFRHENMSRSSSCNQIFSGIQGLVIYDSPRTNVEKLDIMDFLDGAGYGNLLNYREGYGRNALGGTNGELVTVTTLADAGPGSLRSFLEVPGKMWVRFGVSGTITLSGTIDMYSDKTIDGIGADIKLEESGLIIVGEQNIIIHNIKIGNIYTNDNDCITISRCYDVDTPPPQKGPVQDIWVDHVSVSNTDDELISIVGAFDTGVLSDITISWVNYTANDGRADNEGKGNLIAYGLDGTSITMHHNWYHQLYDRQPHVRHDAHVHFYNNWLYDWNGPDGGGWHGNGLHSRIGAELAGEQNLFEPNAGGMPIRTKAGSEAPGHYRCIGDQYINHPGDPMEDYPNDSAEDPGYYKAADNTVGPVFDPTVDYAYVLEVMDFTLRSKLETDSGFQVNPYGRVI